MAILRRGLHSTDFDCQPKSTVTRDTLPTPWTETGLPPSQSIRMKAWVSYTWSLAGALLMTTTNPGSSELDCSATTRHKRTGDQAHATRPINTASPTGNPLPEVTATSLALSQELFGIWNRLTLAAVTATNLQGLQREALPAIRGMELPISPRTN